MDDIQYPDFPKESGWALNQILSYLEDDPNYLDHAPYDIDTIEALERCISIQIDETPIEDFSGDAKWAKLERESNRLFKALTEAGATLNNADQAQKMAYFRTATSLLDKIVGIQERVNNLKQIQEFHSTVLTVMEDILDAGQRTEVLDRLKQVISND
jgi:hypothetical protein